ncbi:hypothetical protein JCGZ_11038 [Jatropha curcas]|uniref:Uncharacterized protein n=1 Tax=Jatropha curcas TaxID=180498 RepID=A0A067KJ71_JATCU|nr:hypothetical protein JCGZ_11038 [Jatropha curcas]
MVVIGGFCGYLLQTVAMIKCSTVGGRPLDGAFFEGLWMCHLGRCGCVTWEGLGAPLGTALVALGDFNCPGGL